MKGFLETVLLAQVSTQQYTLQHTLTLWLQHCSGLTTPTTDTPSNTDDGGVTVLPETVPATTPTGTTPPASTTPLPAQPTDPPSTTPPASSSPPPTDTPLTDECASDALNNCHANARCIDLNDGFRCRCLRGFTGNGVKCKG